jgi:hypothetical protein
VKSAEIAEIERIFVAAEHFDRKSERAMNRRFALSRAVLILAVVAAFAIYLFVGLVAPCMVLIDLTHSEETPLGTLASILTGGVMFGWLIFWTWLISSNPRIEDLGDRIEAWSDGFNDCGRGDLGPQLRRWLDHARDCNLTKCSECDVARTEARTVRVQMSTHPPRKKWQKSY